jgi:hypothetical protein
MDIQSAHKLDLLARNLQTAQTAIDSANEFMQELLELFNTETETAQRASSPFRAHEESTPTPRRRGRWPRDSNTPNLSALLREYIGSHKREVITPDDFHTWLSEEKSVDIDSKRVKNIVSLFSGKDYGILKRVGLSRFKWSGRDLNSRASRDDKPAKNKATNPAEWSTPLVREYFDTHSSDSNAQDIIDWAKKTKGVTLERKKVSASLAYLHKEKFLENKNFGVWAKAA